MNKRQRKKDEKKVLERIDATMQYIIPLGRRKGHTEAKRVFYKVVFSKSYKPYKKLLKRVNALENALEKQGVRD